MNPTQKKTVTAILLIAVIVLVVIFLFLLIDHLTTPPYGGYEEDPPVQERILYDNRWFTPKRHLETILVIGVDMDQNVWAEDSLYGQSDFLLLVTIDRDSETYSVLPINRDTIAEIKGEGYVFTGQLALAHAFGLTEEEKCRNTVSAVSNLLYEIPITHYFCFSLDAVPILNDLVGGVTLELMDDFTHVDPSFLAGARVTLKGSQALAYVRARTGMAEPTNLRRMERQKQYLNELLLAYRSSSSAGDLLSADTLMSLNEVMYTDYSVSQISTLESTLRDYEFTGFRSLKGTSVKGETYMEFHLDDEAAKGLIVELYYREIKD